MVNLKIGQMIERNLNKLATHCTALPVLRIESISDDRGAEQGTTVTRSFSRGASPSTRDAPCKRPRMVLGHISVQNCRVYINNRVP